MEDAIIEVLSSALGVWGDIPIVVIAEGVPRIRRHVLVLSGDHLHTQTPRRIGHTWEKQQTHSLSTIHIVLVPIDTPVQVLVSFGAFRNPRPAADII